LLGAGALAIVASLTACDTGDGKTLRNTVVPTTLPPPDSAPLESVPLDGSGNDQGTTASTLAGVPTATANAAMSITAPWRDGGPIDTLHTCDGDDVSPAISWFDVPEQAVAMALVVTDDDAVGRAPDEGPFVHWAVAGFDPDSISLLEDEVPAGAVQATNSFGAAGWNGPCPPAGDGPHDYRFTLHALGQQVELAEGVVAAEMLPYLDALTITTAEVVGTYER
jgi:Raf kinase inhibitor-like YbhB/YbcL family protein